MKPKFMKGTYSVHSLLTYFKHCKENPDSNVLIPGGDSRWSPDILTASEWLEWFGDCLQKKCSRGTEGQGKGNRSKKRLQAKRDRKATCKWCGALTGKVSRRYCSEDCARSDF